ncbi:hypothetical protein D3C78_851700 [compost metagenome]
MLGSLGQVHGGGLGFLGGARHLHGGLVDGLYQVAQLVDGVVDGVGDGTGEVLGYRGLYGQVAVRQVADFIEQTQNRGLVAVVLLGGFHQAAAGLAHQDQRHEHDRGQGEQAQQVAGQGIEGPADGQVLEAAGQLGGALQHLLRFAEDVVGGLAHLEQFRRGFQDLVHRAGNEGEQFGDLLQTGHGLGIGHLGDRHGRVAFVHARQYATEQAGVATEAVGRLHRVFGTGEHLVHRGENPFGQQGLALGHGHLVGRRTVLQQDIHDLFVLDLQLRNGFRQGAGHLVQRQHGLLAGQNGVGTGAQALPVGLHGGEVAGHRFRTGRQAGIGVTLAQPLPALLEVVTLALQQGEGVGLARRRLDGVLGDPLGQQAQLTGVSDVLLVVFGLLVEVRKVGKQQHHRHDQDGEKTTDQTAAACAREEIACVEFFHLLAPAWTFHTKLFPSNDTGRQCRPIR